MAAIPGSLLLIEDEYALRVTLGDRLRKEGYLVDSASDGEEGLDRALKLPFDLIVLDLMLPRIDGFTVCRSLRDAGLITPVLMLTARARTADKVAGLKIGADDYVTKPFKMPELLARIGALLRRAPTRPQSNEGAAVLEFGRVRVDLRGTEVIRDGSVVSLSAREFQLLRFFLDNPGATLTREELLTRVWGYQGSMFTRTVDVHVSSLRQKLEETPRKPQFVLTVQGFGYKFRPQDGR